MKPITENFTKTEKVLTDDELVSLYVGGNEAGKRKTFNQIYNKYKSHVIGVAMHYLSDKGKAEDMAQDVFTKVAKALDSGKYTPQGQFKAWLKQLTKNHCTDYLRRNFKNKSLITQVDPTLALSLEGDRELNPEEKFIYNERKSDFDEFVNKLTPLRKKIAELLLEGKTYRDIADQLSTGINNIGPVATMLKKFLEKGRS